MTLFKLRQCRGIIPGLEGTQAKKTPRGTKLGVQLGHLGKCRQGIGKVIAVI